MYKDKQGVNSDEYLLGKEIDKAILDSQKEEKLQQQVSWQICNIFSQTGTWDEVQKWHGNIQHIAHLAVCWMSTAISVS